MPISAAPSSCARCRLGTGAQPRLAGELQGNAALPAC
jgi:hypothetical protein